MCIRDRFIYLLYPNVRAAFALKNRTTRIRLADIIGIDELRQQLDHVRTLRFQSNELIWLQGATFAGQSQIFSKGFIDFLAPRRRLPSGSGWCRGPTRPDVGRA